VSTVAVDPVTARWAGALWNLASSQGAVDPVGKDLERLAAEFSSPAVRAFMLAGDASPAERRAKLEQVMGGFHDLSRRFVGLALDRARMGVLERAAAAYRALSLAKAGVVEGVVEAPRPLEAAEVSTLEAKLASELGKTVRLTQRVAPELLGGVRVFVGSRMIDGSATGRLEGLRRRLLDAPLPTPAAID
jgi:F-type H+-transporting ATPase subunit delta